MPSPPQIMVRVFFSQRSWQPSAQLRLGPFRGPLGAAHRLALRASGIAEEGEYARELTKFYILSVVDDIAFVNHLLSAVDVIIDIIFF